MNAKTLCKNHVKRKDGLTFPSAERFFNYNVGESK